MTNFRIPRIFIPGGTISLLGLAVVNFLFLYPHRNMPEVHVMEISYSGSEIATGDSAEFAGVPNVGTIRLSWGSMSTDSGRFALIGNLESIFSAHDYSGTADVLLPEPSSWGDFVGVFDALSMSPFKFRFERRVFHVLAVPEMAVPRTCSLKPTVYYPESYHAALHYKVEALYAQHGAHFRAQFKEFVRVIRSSFWAILIILGWCMVLIFVVTHPSRHYHGPKDGTDEFSTAEKPGPPPALHLGVRST
jgi:hypothetical protein